jgi:hypothetical protein
MIDGICGAVGSCNQPVVDDPSVSFDDSLGCNVKESDHNNTDNENVESSVRITQDILRGGMETCDIGELAAGAGVIILVDVVGGVALVVIWNVATPITAIELIKFTGWIWIPANMAGAYLIFDSNCVKGFNARDWGLED